MAKNAGKYTYFNWASVPSFTVRGFGVSLLGSYQYAGLSDGTNIDIDANEDVGIVAGYAKYFAGNVIKLGVDVKGLVRNEMKGVYAFSTLATYNDQTFPSLFREGAAVGADSGMIITLPNNWLPTFGVAWRDMFNTQFTHTHIINSRASGTPDNIGQSINTAFSVHPFFSRQLKSTIALEYKHWEAQDWPLRKHVHFGMQLEDEKSLYAWLGLNQLYLTLGLGWRVKGGTLEAGTYGEDVGDNNNPVQDRRFFFRYTIGF